MLYRIGGTELITGEFEQTRESTESAETQSLNEVAVGASSAIKATKNPNEKFSILGRNRPLVT